jgi:V-type H+-transporting ATPase subunit F
MNAKQKPNFLVVDKETPVSDIEEMFNTLVKRNDIAVVLINQHIAEMIRHIVDRYEMAVPAVLEIPSKDYPYDPTKDSILRRAKVMKTLTLLGSVA